jgi:hypothetical protein
MSYVKLLGALTVFAGIATAATAAEVPESLRQLDSYVQTAHPFSVTQVQSIDGTVDYTYARDRAAAAYAAGNINEGCRLEAFARRLAGAAPAASCEKVIASSER